MSAKKTEAKVEKSCLWKDLLTGVVFVVGLALAVCGALTLGNDLRPDVEKLFTKAPAELSPGESLGPSSYLEHNARSGSCALERFSCPLLTPCTSSCRIRLRSLACRSSTASNKPEYLV